MENFLISLLLAAVTGLTIVAYRNPDFYEKEFSPKLFYSSVSLILFVLVYGAGVSNTHEEFLALLENSDADEVRAVLERAHIDDRVSIFGVALFVYANFLSWLADRVRGLPDNDIEEE